MTRTSLPLAVVFFFFNKKGLDIEALNIVADETRRAVLNRVIGREHGKQQQHEQRYRYIAIVLSTF